MNGLRWVVVLDNQAEETAADAARRVADVDALASLVVITDSIVGLHKGRIE